MNLLPMTVAGLALDEENQAPLLILKDKEENFVLPIWVGGLEAVSISMPLNKVVMPRPMTHDLFLNLLAELGAVLIRVEITELKESTYYARLVLAGKDGEISVDSRPSDAVALALRAEVPILANEEMLVSVKSKNGTSYQVVLEDKDRDRDKWSEILEDFDPEHTKYKM
ncbi:MAG: bifunctional nuclease family protein [Desulfonatronovibrionaceae bacterium]